MLAHNYSNLAVPMVLGANMDNSQTTCDLGDLSGLPAYPYIVCIDRNLSGIEMLEVTSLSAGTVVNCVRGYGDTVPSAHTAGAPIIHVAPAEFFTDLSTDSATVAQLVTDAGLKVKKLAARNSTTGNIANTETRVIGVTMPTGSLVTGTVIEFEAMGIMTATATSTQSVWRIRVGPTTLTGAICGSWSSTIVTTVRTNVPFVVMGKLTILSSTTAIASISVRTDHATPFPTPTTTITAAVTIATNANQEVELTCISGGASTTWNALNAYMELVAA